LNLVISNLAYGYKNIFVDKISGFTQSGPCHINVLCPQANAWSNERNSVVFIASANGDALCSGALIMNACGTNIPYILTANHCLFPPNRPMEDVSKWRFHFQAWSYTCTPNQNTDGLLFNGSSLKANWGPSDFCLVQLNQTPAASPLILASVLITYSGWSRSTTPPNGVVGIHHPAGDVMKISASSLPVFRSDNTTWPAPGGGLIIPPGVLHWRVIWPSNSAGTPTSGVTEGGSSGSPLYDQNHRIVGQLGGGPSDCSNTSIKQDAYGRFDNSWTGGGTPASRLSDWLDPNNTGASFTNTTSITSLNAFNSSLSLAISGDAQFCSSSNSYSIPNLPAGFSVIWTATPAGVVTINSPNALQTTLTKITDGSFTLKATVTNCQGTIPITKPLHSGSPTPIDGVATTYNVLKCIVRTYKFTLPINGATNFKWFSRNITQGTPFVQFKNGAANWATQGGDGSCDQIEIKVETTNACNTTSPQIFTFPSDMCPPFLDGSCTYGRAITASPNPAATSIDINLMEEPNVKPKNTQPLKIEAIKILNKEGQTKKTIKGNNLVKMKIDISDLPNDVYTIMVFDGKAWITEQVIKN
jgi:lysyl endopeptidase